MKMYRSQQLLALGVGLARSHAFVAPAGASVLRQYATALTRTSLKANQACSTVAHGMRCPCSRCTGGAGMRLSTGLRMMSTEEADAPVAGGTKLYIGNLGWDTTTEDLQEEFAKYGDTTDCYVVIDRVTGESRGFGFVTFTNEQEANEAVAAMNGLEMEGRRIRVAVSKPKSVAAPEGDGCKLYVGNLGYDTTADQLESRFAEYGTISDLTVVTDRDTGNSRGFGFITYSSAAEAAAAADNLDGAEVDGRTIRVNISRPRAERNTFSEGGGNNFRSGGGGGDAAVDSSKLFVGNLGWDTTSEDLQQAFAQYGDVVDAKVVTDRETGNSRGFGFVTFQSTEAAENAIGGMDGMELDGREIRVNISQPKKPRFQDSSYDEQW
eukprot:TRINITY_DN3063_c0_g1_i1.p1 TRINITY_DN3063_c0_g1~~TRINITY_DN3063_c0_g1_i1.p1  ORF type:complete len:380 (+),score=107.75 TRINITY_DN3063_c0_g1_i1:75-1214(+)